MNKIYLWLGIPFGFFAILCFAQLFSFEDSDWQSIHDGGLTLIWVVGVIALLFTLRQSWLFLVFYMAAAYFLVSLNTFAYDPMHEEAFYKVLLRMFFDTPYVWVPTVLGSLFAPSALYSMVNE